MVRFISGIGNSEIKSHVVLHHPKTLESVISLAHNLRGYNSSSVIKPRVNSVQTQDENAQAPDKLSTLVKT